MIEDNTLMIKTKYLRPVQLKRKGQKVGVLIRLLSF